MVFEVDAFVAKCVAEFGAAAATELMRGRVPGCVTGPELSERVRGEYEASIVQGEFDFSVCEMVSGVFADREGAAFDDKVCTWLAASELLDMCVVGIVAAHARLVVGAVAATIASRRRVAAETEPGTEPRSSLASLASLPDALLVRIAESALDDARRARAGYKDRRAKEERELVCMLLSACMDETL